MNSGDFLNSGFCFINLPNFLSGLIYTYSQYSDGYSGYYDNNFIYCNTNDILNTYNSSNQTGNYCIQYLSDGYTGYSCKFLYESGSVLNVYRQTNLTLESYLTTYADGMGNSYTEEFLLNNFYSFGYYVSGYRNIAPYYCSFECAAYQAIDDSLFYYYHIFNQPLIANGDYCNGIFSTGNYVSPYNIPSIYVSGDVVCENNISLNLYQISIDNQDACQFLLNNDYLVNIGKCCICYDGASCIDISSSINSGQSLYFYSGIDATGVSNVDLIFDGISGYVKNKTYISGTTLSTGSIYLDLGVECLVENSGSFICCGMVCVINGYYLINSDGVGCCYTGGNAYEYGLNPNFSTQYDCYNYVCDFFQNINLKNYNGILYYPYACTIYTGILSGIIDGDALRTIKFKQPVFYDFTKCEAYTDCYFPSRNTGFYCIDYMSDGNGCFLEKNKVYYSGTNLVCRIPLWYKYQNIGCTAAIGEFNCYSNGVDGFYDSGFRATVASGDAVYGKQHCLYISETNSYAFDGYLLAYFQGNILNPSVCECTDFCSSGTLILSSHNYLIYSDGSGGYYSEVNLGRNYNCLKLNFDFDQETKNKYFNCVTGSCACYIIKMCDANVKPFYEFNFDNLALVNLDFIQENQKLNIENIKNSFIYVKNNGCENLIIKTSQTNFCENFSDNRIFYRTNFSENKNYELKNNEGVFLYFESDPAGNNYKINACYNYQFSYQFLNVSDLNPCGFYPICQYDRLCVCPNLLNMYEDICNYTAGYYVHSGIPAYLPTYSLNTMVDKGAKLNIKYICSGATNSCVDIASIFGYSCLFSTICIDKIKIQNNLNIDIFEGCNISIINYETDINENTCISILYNIQYCSNRKDNYFICSSFDCNHSIVNFYQLDKYNTLNWLNAESASSGILTQKSEFCDNSLMTRVLLCENILACNPTYIKDLKTLNFSAENIYLSSGYGNYNFYTLCSIFGSEMCCSGIVYDFYLKTSNYYEGLNEFSGLNYDQDYTDCDFIENKSFINYLTIVDSSYTGVPDFLKSNTPNSINLCLNKNIIDTTCFCTKDSGSVTEDFNIFYCDSKCNFSYCGLSFEYIPADYILNNNLCIKIPNSCTGVTLNCNDITVSFFYPLDAINEKMIKVSNNLNISENYDFADIEYNFNLNNINFKNKICPDINNSSCLSVHAINNYISGENNIQYPNLNINLISYKNIENNFCVYLNIFNCFNDQHDFCLYSFFRLIYSQLNSGEASFLNSQNSPTCCVSQTGIYIHTCELNQENSKYTYYNNYTNYPKLNDIIFSNGNGSGNIKNITNIDLSGVLNQEAQAYCLSDMGDVVWLYYNAHLPISCDIYFCGAKFEEFVQTANLGLISGSYIYPDHFQTCAESELVEGSTLYGSGFSLTGDNDTCAWLTFSGYCFDISSFFEFPTGSFGYGYLTNCRILATDYNDFASAICSFFNYHPPNETGLFNGTTGFENFSISNKNVCQVIQIPDPCIYLYECSGKLFEYIKYSGHNLICQNGMLDILTSPFFIENSNSISYSGLYSKNIQYYCYFNNLKNECYLYHSGENYLLNNFFIPDYSTLDNQLFTVNAYLDNIDLENNSSNFLNYVEFSGYSTSSPIDNLNYRQRALFILNLTKEACSYLCSCSASASTGTIDANWNTIIECKLYTYKFDNDPISYKKYSDKNYSYIQLINSYVCFTDQFTFNCLYDNDFSCSGLLNNKLISQNYFGGTDEFPCIVSGNQCYDHTGGNIICDNYFNLNKNNFHVYVDSESFKTLHASGYFCRNIYLEKKYDFTGILPVFINSNTALSYMNCNIFDECYLNYCYNSNFNRKNLISGIFYYTYDLSNYNENNIENINFITPNYINFNFVCYLDNNSGIVKTADTNNNNIYYGFLIKNAAQLNFDLKNSIKNNSYIYNPNYYICINSTSSI